MSKSSCDSDGLSSIFLKKIALTVSNPLKIIFEKSFSTGIVPTQLKTAKIIPLYKGGDPLSPDNYRPIAMLSVFAKVIEKVVFKKLMDHVDNNNILSPQQFGFRKDHATIHPMLHFCNHITKALEKKEHSIAIFCDLRKAFDTVNIEILLKKKVRKARD